MTNLLALPTGTVLASDYRIERVLGAGGFGITYLAEETPLARLVTIKEYFPADYAARDGGVDACPRSRDCAEDYRWGLDRFLEEAQTLAKFDHANIVRVYRYFRANNTGYMVLHFEEGQSFKGWLKSLGRAPRQHELDRVIAPLLDALELIHGTDFLHRDIAPDNIIIRKDGSPVLIDFGSARGEIAQHSMTVSALIKPGYSPYEQYATNSRQQGPWSDIYSLGATLYQAITGKRPPDAPSRMVADELIPVRDAALSSYRPAFLMAIDKALTLEITGRPKSVAVWRADLLNPQAQAAATSEPAARDSVPAAAKAATVPHQVKAAVPDPVGTLMPRLRGLLSAWTARIPEEKPGAFLVQALAQAKPEVVAKALVKAKPVRRHAPRPGRSYGRRSWRPLAIKLLIGLGVASAAVGMQDKFPAVERRGGSTVLSQPPEPAPVIQLKGHNGTITGIAFAGDGKWIVSTGADGTIKVWDTASRALVRTLELDAGPATAIATEGRRAVTGHRDGTVVLWDLETGDKLASYKRSDASIWSVAFTGDPERFAASSHDWTVMLFDARTRSAPVQLLEGHDSAVQALTYSQASHLLVSGAADRTVKLWDPAVHRLIRTYRGHSDAVTAVSVTPDGRVLASAGLDGAIRLWSTTSNRTHRILRGHRGRITALAFSPDGQLLVSAGDDGAVKLWEFRRGRTARNLHGHTGEVHSLSFAPDGRRLASAGSDGIVRLWEVGAIKPGS
jgi:serine/threonine protein kinase